MKILHTATITIAIVLMIIVSPMAFWTLSFAARTNSTGTSAQHNNITASSKIPNINTPKIATTTPASHNTTNTNTNTTLMGAPGGYTCSNADNFLWNHVYGASGNGKEPWSQPGPNHPGTSRLKELTPSCIRVTGTVYSAYPGGTRDDPDGDGDLHFTLTLDNAYKMYSNGKPGPDRIIVEVICHTTPTGVYDKTGKWGDYCKTSTGTDVIPAYPKGQFPKQGAKLTVSGKFVFDNGKEQWNEIHPASNIK
jgi:hypothetical protein